ncbi:peptidase M15B and M15C [Streptomyces laurentii]|uniref:Peptidase M15B and M15C n=1 Tax=Streptomyces laurentii TaxID=39478 RepID=A0A160NX48_STRLU|nr:peptidase M15B and M15C [Streptomyces laurentii]
MHDDDPTANEAATAVRRSPGRTATTVGAVAAVAVAALAVTLWGTGPGNKPAAPAAGAPPGTSAVAPEDDDDSEQPDGRPLTPFDTRYPAVGRLDAGLLKAVQEAARDARADGIEFRVTSGWRTKDHQQRLLDEAVKRYGSTERARQYVSTPQKSAHVTGKAVDIGPTDADDWLIRKGARYGLCQVYNNEMWHFELLTSPGGTCPSPLTDAAG